ncbi:MAG: hypothetical protein K2L87_02570, partial [Clostridiales bacterium]|nr:hypothetical protein [Clostridiales bacterium]
MLKMKSKKRVATVIAAVLAAAILALGTLLMVFMPTQNTMAEVGDRVTMIDLIGRYPVDYVVGPVDVVDVNKDGKIDRKDLNEEGKYTYKDGNIVRNADGSPVLDKDDNEIPTNNVYGIPAEKYFDVENYIFTQPDDEHTFTVDGKERNGRILYGWKPNIRAVVSTISTTGKPTRTDTKLAENGEILTTGGKLYENEADTATGIFVTYTYQTTTKLKEFGTTEKYALIVPSDVTSVGQGSAAFVADDENGELTTYYNDFTVNEKYVTTGDVKTAATDADKKLIAQFTDFACFTMRGLQPDVAPYFWQPRERLAGVFFPEDSHLIKITGSINNTV